MSKTLLFIGATGGCGFSALRRALDAGHTCLAICRTPSKLTAKLPKTYANLHITKGNAHDVSVLKQALISPSNPNSLVDAVYSSIGGVFLLSKMDNDDPTVCANAMSALLAAITELRQTFPAAAAPRVVAVSSAGLSDFQRDVPLVMLPVYRTMLLRPHADKRAMEKMLRDYEGPWTLIRPSHLTDGPEADAVRIGVEDPVKGVESSAIGFSVSREDVGKWVYENILSGDGSDAYVGKAVAITC